MKKPTQTTTTTPKPSQAAKSTQVVLKSTKSADKITKVARVTPVKRFSKSEMLETINSKIETEIPKKVVAEVFNAMVDIFRDRIRKGHQVYIPHMGMFSTYRRAARTGRSPVTGEPLKIKATKTVRFRASADLKKLVAGR